jgi:dTDP-4-dehydrorhamnose 3,5-epimerase
MNFTFAPQQIPEVLLVGFDKAGDERGFFSETYRSDAFAAAGIPPLVQDNHSRSRQGVLRGLHYQKAPHVLGKLVRCIRGRIFDVAVDLRRNSESFGRWVGAELGEDSRTMLWVPSGFAHGFCTLSDVAEVLYRQTDYYAPALERSIRWNDPTIAVDWPVREPVLSARDAAAPLLGDAEIDFLR